MNLHEFKNAISEAKEFAKAEQTNSALFDLAAALAILAQELDSDLREIKRTLAAAR